MLTNTNFSPEIENFKALIEQLDKVFFVRDAKSQKMLYVSPAFENLWGMSRDVLFKNPSSFTELVHPTDRRSVIKRHITFLSKKTQFEESYRIIRADKSIRWISAKTIPVFDEKGELYQIAGIAEDITRQKQLENILHEVEKVSKVGGWEFELTNKQFTLTDGVYNICELPTGHDLSFEEALNFFTPSSKFKLIKALKQAFVDSKNFSLDLEFITALKTKIWLRTAVKPTHCNRNVCKFIGTIQDITSTKEAEYKLIEQKTEAEEAAYAQSICLSTMSHEIRTPMNAVIGMTHLLLSENPKPSQVTPLRTLKFSAENLMVLINDILDYNKLESGKFTFENIPFSLREVAEDVKEAFAHKAKEKSISIKLKLDADIPTFVKGDKVRLTQILNNLVSNAIKFTEKGGITIDIEVKETEGNTVQIYFSVADTGIGIPKDKQHAIFEQFTQASPDTSRKYGGTGLGLPIAKKLLSLQKSDLNLTSEEGKGAQFYFELSFDKVNKNIRTSPKSLPKVYDLKRINVLVVEDNRINQLVARRFLEKWGAVIDIVEDGKVAVERVQKKDYDIVLMDLEMPKMNGYEATKIIRKMGGDYAFLPIIALTASAMQDVKEKVINAGMNDYIQKPFHPDDFYNTMTKYYKLDEQSLGKKFVDSGQILDLDKLWEPQNLFSIINGSEDFFNQFYETAENSLLEFTRIYEVSLLSNDVNSYRQNAHKAKSVLKLIGAQSVIKELQVGRNLVEDPQAKHADLILSIEKVQRHIEQIFAEMKQCKEKLLTGENC
ncbi:ATP-binding protein [Flammeovirgaceae bacterium SG7u.111]|nr:ATP-binding protein [Flammeovirgaceae bacterium SG7u.132]WPO35334.1 ATP-binding protein [Flammeovirgaceae bacterium SG7u.111]